MSTLTLELEDELVQFLAQSNQPIEQTAREMIVFELFRRGVLSGGKAAELLHLARLTFIQRASELGIKYFQFDEDEWGDELRESERI